MVDPMRSIRVSDGLWKQAKLDAVQQDMALQDWLALAIIRLLDDNRRDSVARMMQESGITEPHIAGKGVKR